jgi:outer membrane protein
VSLPASLHRLLVLLLLVSPWPWPALAQTTLTTPSAEPAVADPGRGEALAIEAQFQEGLQALDAGDSETAIRRFTSILALNPRLHRVRLELARAYFVAEDWADARREFFAVLSADVPDAVKDTIIRFLRLIDIRRGWSWDLDAGLRSGPESGRRYSSDTVTLNVLGQNLPFKIDRQSSPDVGAFVAGGLEYRERVTALDDSTILGDADLSLIARGDGEANVYDDDDFNELIYGGSLAAQLAWQRTSLQVGPDVVWRRFGGDARDNRYGVATSIEHRLPEGIALFSRVGWSRVEDDLFSGRDGDLWSSRFGVSRSIGGRSTISGIVSVNSFDAEADWESYRSGRLELRGRTELVFGLAPTLSLAGTYTRYRETAPFFLNRRRDRQYSANLEIEKRDLFIGPFAPFVSVGYIRNDSNIEIHDYHEWVYRAGLRKIF